MVASSAAKLHGPSGRAVTTVGTSTGENGYLDLTVADGGSMPSDGRRRTLKTSERVALDIVHDIVAQGLHTGARLPLEAEMVDDYGVSRSSLREALRLLEVQGLIRLKPGPGGGPVVGAVDASNLARTVSLYFHLGAATYHDLLATQVLLEPMCAQLAAANPDRRRLMEPFFEPVPTDDDAGYHRDTVAFHTAIYVLAANPVLRLLTEAITHMVSDHVLATMDPVDLHSAIAAEHAAIARAVANGHAARSHQLMAAHFEAQHDFYRRTIPARLGQLIEWR
jgi:GntR family transcriptional regulator, transcriptional repressor for pyruvate dehydrogenase complex